MTLNKYQKANEQIRLRESDRQAILAGVLNADPKPKKKFSLSFAGWGALAAAGAAVLLFILLPRPSMSAAPQNDAAAGETYREEEAVMDAAAEETGMTREEAERMLGQSLVNLEQLEGVESVEYRSYGGGSVEISLSYGGTPVLILAESDLVTSAQTLEMEEPADTANTTGTVRYTITYPEGQDDALDEILRNVLEGAS